MKQMGNVPGGELEQAITCLNRADALNAEREEKPVSGDIVKLLLQARDLIFAADVPRNGYFAFVCEKCAPGFRYYGDEDTAGKLERLAEEIYAGT